MLIGLLLAVLLVFSFCDYTWATKLVSVFTVIAITITWTRMYFDSKNKP